MLERYLRERGYQGFEPTYKELKQILQSEDPVFFAGFEPTYKELKPR